LTICGRVQRIISSIPPTHFAIAAKCFSIFSGYSPKGK
jgi:hypothetical protein